MTFRLRLNNGIFNFVIATAVLVVIIAEARASDVPSVRQALKGDLAELKSLLIDIDDAVKKNDDLIQNPNRPDGQVQFNIDASKFTNSPGCRHPVGDESPCQGYLGTLHSLEERKRILAAQEAENEQRVHYLESRFQVKIGIIKSRSLLLGCLPAFAESAVQCAARPPEPAGACLDYLWANSSCLSR